MFERLRNRARRLREAGVLGLNSRNGSVIAPRNNRALYPLVDDKAQTKQLLENARIAVPALYACLRSPVEIRSLSERLCEFADFVIKPAHGSGGAGVLVISGRSRDAYLDISGQLITEQQFQFHAYNILSGMYSLGGHPDQVLIEYRVDFDPVFEQISYLGVPDVRIILSHGVPVMAMLRSPTRHSHGKANLHQGAIGCGISIRSGRTVAAIWYDEAIEEHPDTGAKVIGVEIPRWKELLLLSAKCYDVVALGYMGVDIVFDRELGPLVLELNARPGLSIQIANREGLRTRLDAVEQNVARGLSASGRVELATTLFSSHLELHSDLT